METLLRNFWLKVKNPDGCWIWNGAVRRGYPALGVSGKAVAAHRLSYEWFKGPIPSGMTIDHLCKKPLCVNPDHMEAVPIGVNVLRGSSPVALNAKKKFCKRGHPFDEKNTRLIRNGKARRCRTCEKMAMMAQ